MTKSINEELAIYNDVANLCLSENAPEQMAAHKRFETALYSHGVYEAAAQGLAYVNREAATATGAHLEVLEAARSMIYARAYSTETLKALAKAKTFKEREIIRKKATDDATAKKEAEQAAQNAEAERKHKERLAEEARKKAENAEAVELDRKYKEATIRLADNFGKAATTTPPNSTEQNASLAPVIFGSIEIFKDFTTVLFDGHTYDLRTANQAREILRYLVNEKASSAQTGKSKVDILTAIKKRNSIIQAHDWKPSDAFKGKNKNLHGAIEQRGAKYWIKP